MADISSQDIRLWHDHRVLKAVHLQGREVTLEIESIAPGKIVGVGGKTDRMPMIKFKGKDLPFGLNRTNENTIVAMYGATPRDLVGKRITLFPTTCKGKEGNVVECIRIRPTIPKGGPDTGPQASPSGGADEQHA